VCFNWSGKNRRHGGGEKGGAQGIGGGGTCGRAPNSSWNDEGVNKKHFVWDEGITPPPTEVKKRLGGKKEEKESWKT